MSDDLVLPVVCSFESVRPVYIRPLYSHISSCCSSKKEKLCAQPKTRTHKKKSVEEMWEVCGRLV